MFEICFELSPMFTYLLTNTIRHLLDRNVMYANMYGVSLRIAMWVTASQSASQQAVNAESSRGSLARSRKNPIVIHVLLRIKRRSRRRKLYISSFSIQFFSFSIRTYIHFVEHIYITRMYPRNIEKLCKPLLHCNPPHCFLSHHIQSFLLQDYTVCFVL